MEDLPGGVDVSGLHRELDRVKTSLCRCRHEGTCVACRGFEMLRQQAQMVIAAASQPVLLQVAQEVAVDDLVTQMGGFQAKLADDPQLQELIMRMVERVQEDLGGPAELEKMFGSMGLFGGQPGGPIPPDDRPSSSDRSTSDPSG